MDHHKPGSRLKLIKKQLKVAWASLRAITCKYSNLWIIQTWQHSAKKHKWTPKTRAKELVKKLELSGTKVCTPSIKRFLNCNCLKSCCTKKKPCHQQQHKKARLWVIVNHLVRWNEDCWPIMRNNMYGWNSVRHLIQRTPCNSQGWGGNKLWGCFVRKGSVSLYKTEGRTAGQWS